MNPEINLQGQVALITGASAGLGQHFAQLLAGHGARVALVARDEKRLALTANTIRANGGECEYFTIDLTRTHEISELVEQINARLGVITLLVNNAGMMALGSSTKLSIDDIEASLAINVRVPFILSREVAKRLIEAKLPGRIINLSSITSFHYPGDGAAIYSTTKAAVNRMTETLAMEWVKHRINVNAIAPGTIEAGMTDRLEARVGDIRQRYPRGRLGLPQQLDSTLLYLCSPASELVTGTIIKVDDGQFTR